MHCVHRVNDQAWKAFPLIISVFQIYIIKLNRWRDEQNHRDSLSTWGMASNRQSPLIMSGRSWGRSHHNNSHFVCHSPYNYWHPPRPSLFKCSEVCGELLQHLCVLEENARNPAMFHRALWVSIRAALVWCFCKSVSSCLLSYANTDLYASFSDEQSILSHLKSLFLFPQCSTTNKNDRGRKWLVMVKEELIKLSNTQFLFIYRQKLVSAWSESITLNNN